jgi:hypothetical protein
VDKWKKNIAIKIKYKYFSSFGLQNYIFKKCFFDCLSFHPSSVAQSVIAERLFEQLLVGVVQIPSSARIVVTLLIVFLLAGGLLQLLEHDGRRLAGERSDLAVVANQLAWTRTGAVQHAQPGQCPADGGPRSPGLYSGRKLTQLQVPDLKLIIKNIFVKKPFG